MGHKSMQAGGPEPVKVWDIRRLVGGHSGAHAGEAAAQPVITLQTQSSAVTQVAWSPTRAGVLATISADQRWISLWDLNRGRRAEKMQARSSVGFPYDSASDSDSADEDIGGCGVGAQLDGSSLGGMRRVTTISKPFQRRYASEELVSFSWQPPPTSSITGLPVAIATGSASVGGASGSLPSRATNLPTSKSLDMIKTGKAKRSLQGELYR
jgi:WD40 repeat protein